MPIGGELTVRRNVDGSCVRSLVSNSPEYLGRMARRQGYSHRFICSRLEVFNFLVHDRQEQIDSRKYFSFGSPPLPLMSFVILVRTW
jgi:hypothetical protein